VTSNRAATRHRLHAQARYAWSRHQISGHYEWVRARDNTAGPFSFAERAEDLTAEWARSAGQPAHAVTVTAAFALPAQTSFNITQTWRSGSPYDITTGRDRVRNNVYLDRGGRPRNSGEGASYHDVSLYAFRRFAVPDTWLPGSARLRVNVGLQASNILDNRSYTTMGSVAEAATFGRPLAAYPGRSVRLFLSFD
jgi:hypothetical protein